MQAIETLEDSCPSSIESLRACVAHHLIPLLLLSNSDGERADVELEAIVDHCVAKARRHDVVVDDQGLEDLELYIAEYRPALMQLDPALRLIEGESHEDLLMLLAAAEIVASADGQLDPAEQALLAELKDEATRIAASALS